MRTGIYNLRQDINRNFIIDSQHVHSQTQHMYLSCVCNNEGKCKHTQHVNYHPTTKHFHFTIIDQKLFI